MKAARALSVRLQALYAAVFLFLAFLAGWLVWDLLRERERTLELAEHLVMQKSQFMGRAFGDTFLATDYVLRDVLGHLQPARDLREPEPDPLHRQRIEGLLRLKAASIPALEDLALFDHRCVYTAFAHRDFYGRKSNQRFCADLRVEPGEHLYMQYIATPQSASARPVLVIARTLGDAQGRLQGGALAVMDLQYAQQWLADFEVETHDNLALLDTDGHLLARMPPLPERVGQRIPPTPSQPAFQTFAGVATFTDASPVDERVRIYGVSRLERFPLVAVVGFDQATMLKAWRHRAWQLGAGYIGLLILCLLVLRFQLTMLHQREELRRLATTDALTGIANRGQLMTVGAQEHARAQRYHQPLSVLMLDLDHFKSVNDRWGHATGDRVIREVAQILRSIARSQDLPGRLGGEEFALLLPATPLAGARIIAERLRLAVQDAETVHADEGEPVRFTVSVGVAALDAQDPSFESLLQRADRAMYQAKAGGRNRVELIHTDTPARRA